MLSPGPHASSCEALSPASFATHLQVSELVNTRRVLPVKSCSLVVPSMEEAKNWLVLRRLNFSPVMLPPAPIYHEEGKSQ